MAIGNAIKWVMEDHTPEYMKELEKKKLEILDAWGNELQKGIHTFMMLPPQVYDTGRLYNSISYCTPNKDVSNLKQMNQVTDRIQGLREKNTVFYGSNVPYAEWVENGTSKQRARHYVKQGTEIARPKLKAVMEKILKLD